MMAVETRPMECARDMAYEAMDRTSEIVQQNPGLSMLVVFGIGAGIGALLGEALMAGLPAMRSETTAEKIGRQICETLNIKY